MTVFDQIREEIIQAPEGYQGYRRLGDFYRDERGNHNQAYICYEQAKAFAQDEAVRQELNTLMDTCRATEGFEVHPASFMILSYNSKDMMIDCVESIRKGCAPGSYEIVIVDNDSKDGIRDYLTAQDDLVLELNDHNTSFAGGCNQGAKLASGENDILFLNNDTIVPPFALFYMRLALYDSADIGSVGPTSNAVLISQLAPGAPKSKEQWLMDAPKVHVPDLNAIENKAWLVGFALLIKRRVWDLVGCFDERFVRGFYEDTDLGFRILRAGFRNVLCHNSYIFHYGSVSMKKDPVAYNKAISENEKRLEEKLGLDFQHYMFCNDTMIDMLQPKEDGSLSVLEIGSRFGLTVSKARWKFKGSRVVGVEKSPEAAALGKTIADIILGDIEKDVMPFEGETFDYLLLPDVIGEFKDPVKTLRRLHGYLKADGKVIVLIPNVMNAFAVIEMLSGKYQTVESLNRHSNHHYSLTETFDLLRAGGFRPYAQLNMATDYMDTHPREKAVLDAIRALPGVTVGDSFKHQSFVVTCTKG